MTLATRSGVRSSPSRVGSSPIARSSCATAFSASGWSSRTIIGVATTSPFSLQRASGALAPEAAGLVLRGQLGRITESMT